MGVVLQLWFSAFFILSYLLETRVTVDYCSFLNFKVNLLQSTSLENISVYICFYKFSKNSYFGKTDLYVLDLSQWYD
jgi:hypothetical protein